MIRKQTHGNERDKLKKKTNANRVAEDVKSRPEQKNPTDPYEMLGISRVNVNEHRRIARRIWYNEFIERLIKDASQKGRKKKKVHFNDDVLQIYRNLLEREASDEFDRVVKLAQARSAKGGLPRESFWNEWCRLICKHQRAQGHVVEEIAGEGAEKKAKARFEYLLELLKELQESGLDRYMDKKEKAKFDGNLAKVIASYSEIIVEDQGWDYFRSKGKFYRPRTYMTPSGLFDYEKALYTLEDPEKVIAVDYDRYVNSKANYEDLKLRFEKAVNSNQVDLILDGEIHDLWKEYGFYDVRKNAEKCIVATMDALEPVHLELRKIGGDLKLMLETGKFDVNAEQVKEVRAKFAALQKMYNMFNTLVQEASDRLLIDTDEMSAIREVQERIEENIENMKNILKAINEQYQSNKQSSRQDSEFNVIKSRTGDFVKKDEEVVKKAMRKMYEQYTHGSSVGEQKKQSVKQWQSKKQKSVVSKNKSPSKKGYKYPKM